MLENGLIKVLRVPNFMRIKLRIVMVKHGYTDPGGDCRQICLRIGLTVYHRSTEIIRPDGMKKLLIFLLVILFLSGCNFWELDKCLDRGGKWNYEERGCVLKENQ
jgi:hypothetical protein